MNNCTTTRKCKVVISTYWINLFISFSISFAGLQSAFAWGIGDYPGACVKVVKSYLPLVSCSPGCRLVRPVVVNLTVGTIAYDGGYYFAYSPATARPADVAIWFWLKGYGWVMKDHIGYEKYDPTLVELIPGEFVEDVSKPPTSVCENFNQFGPPDTCN